jgi:hypothetical protein
LQGYRGGIVTRLHTGKKHLEVCIFRHFVQLLCE